ncbi:hypothetical protein CXF95_20715 [Paraglaciecola sp. MB-3u-78]|nr:hypothetical protein CXF95_20715 [Paraglaciecola sp. MB-3u-78]
MKLKVDLSTLNPITDIVFSDNLNELVNMSVWESVDALRNFMFKKRKIGWRY